MKKFLIFLLFLSPLLAATAQQRTTTLRGTVLDGANNNPLVGALVVVDGTRHAIVDANGNFSVAGNPRGQSAKVEISFMGYNTVSQTIDASQGTVNMGTLRLREEGRAIEAITVTGNSNIAIQKGDTTQFNASAFKTNPDADAGDLVGKLPGATVEDGTVTIQGETVERAYVDGKLFFGDDVMSAMRNLPADAIESIQMFDELSDEAKFVGFDDGSRRRALNIVTKHKVNRSTTGRIEAGYGLELDKDAAGNYQNRYLVSGNVNTFTDKNRWSLNGTANNMNRANRGDGFQGGGGGGMRGGGQRTINSIGLNYSGTWSPELKFNASYSFNENRSTTDSWSSKDYYSGDRMVRDTTYSKAETNAHQGNIRLEYEGAKNRLFLMGRGSYQKNDGLSNSLSSTWLGGNPITDDPNTRLKKATLSNGDDYSGSGNLIWTHKLGQKSGRTFTAGIGGNINDKNSEEDRTTLSEIGMSDNVHTYTVTDERGYGINGRLSYAEPLSPRSRLMATYRISYTDTESDVQAWDQIKNEIDTGRSNTYSQNYLTNTGEVGYSYSDDKFRVSGSIAYQVSDRQREQAFPETDNPMYNRSFRSWQPFANVRYMVDKSKYFEFRYNGRASLPSLENLQEVIRESQTGNTVTVGNPDLKQSYSHQFRLRYNTANVEKSTNFWTVMDARLTQDNVSYETFFFDRDTLLVFDDYTYPALAGTELRKPVNLDGAVSFQSMAGYSFTFRPLKINVNLMGGYNYSRTPSYIQGSVNKESLLNYANSHGGNFRVGFVSNISENVDFDLSSFTRLSYTYNSTQENRRIWNENVAGRLNVIFPLGITYNTDFSWMYQYTSGQNGGATNSYIWNMGVGYKFLPRKTAEFRVTMYDLLNQSQKAPRATPQDTYTSTNWTRSMGRYVMATLSFRFNSMNRLTSGAARENSGGERRMMGPSGGRPGQGGQGGGYGGYRGGGF